MPFSHGVFCCFMIMFPSKAGRQKKHNRPNPKTCTTNQDYVCRRRLWISQLQCCKTNSLSHPRTKNPIKGNSRGLWLYVFTGLLHIYIYIYIPLVYAHVIILEINAHSIILEINARVTLLQINVYLRNLQIYNRLTVLQINAHLTILQIRTIALIYIYIYIYTH